MTRKKDRPYGGSLKNKVDALFGSANPPEATRELSIESITLPEYQPRQYFDEAKLVELADTIAKHGILEPLLVRRVEGDCFELVAGGRRYRAAQMEGLTKVPVVVLELTDEEALELALLENLQREDLNPIEETEGILRLLEARLKLDQSEVLSLLYRMRNEVKGATSRNVSASPSAQVVEELFAPLGMTWKSFVETRLPLLKLPEEILEALRKGRIEYTKAKAIALVKNEARRKALLEEAIASSLSLSQIKERIKAHKPSTERGELQSRFDATTKQIKKLKVWDDPSKRSRLESLLAQLEALIASE
ncbi:MULTISPECIES: ParB/RepB/Spo0J family partition protein [unclassified Coleofasciculus]|uniref:ParB/RepB/Spo0J family partition protein n=1 Tax=unclassified Coleofasciculus TaxID=2692782 RepID=UPI00187F4FA2|nr:MULTISPECIES: ParB/RepB/Spo0J family partition protein [unclassified Coleofasciculus]MBE9129894.1 ParB/RepB/Spo0J family partition protein [Coleofasciculus sp. LEGE 07081]MBE9150614.1 ParB/RepB/Spo0J family partition protein [Coleofasciculus sp. LEGE 07092]